MSRIIGPGSSTRCIKASNIEHSHHHYTLARWRKIGYSLTAMLRQFTVDLRRFGMLQRICFAIVFVFSMMWSAATGLASGPLAVSSPDGNIEISFQLKCNPQPYLSGERAYYRVSYKGQQVLGDSPLGLDFKDAKALDQDFAIVGSELQSQESTWENPLGAKRKVPDHYNQLTVSLRERLAPSRRLDRHSYRRGLQRKSICRYRSAYRPGAGVRAQWRHSPDRGEERFGASLFPRPRRRVFSLGIG